MAHFNVNRRSLTFVLFAALLAAIVLSGSCRAQPPQRRSFERAQEILKLSEEAAKSGMSALSLRAAKEALGGGLPFPGQSLTIPPTDADDPQQHVTDKIERSVAQLVDIWIEQKTEPGQIYELLRDIVLPPAQSKIIVLGQRRDGVKEFTAQAPQQSIGAQLVRAAMAAGRTSELVATIEPRLEHPSSRIDAAIVLLLVAEANHNHDLARRVMLRFASSLDENDDTTHAATLAEVLVAMARQRELKASAHQAVSKLIQTSLTRLPSDDPMVDVVAELSLLVASERLASDDKADASSALELLMAISHRNARAGSAASERNRFLERGWWYGVRAAGLMLLFGLRDEAVPELWRLNELDSQLRIELKSKPLRSLRLHRLFHELPADQRFELLLSALRPLPEGRWLFPIDRSEQSPGPPEWFTETLPETLQAAARRCWHSASASDSNPAQWLVQAAIDSGKLTDLEVALNATTNTDDFAIFYKLELPDGARHLGELKTLLTNELGQLKSETNQKAGGRNAFRISALVQLGFQFPETQDVSIEVASVFQPGLKPPGDDLLFKSSLIRSGTRQSSVSLPTSEPSQLPRSNDVSSAPLTPLRNWLADTDRLTRTGLSASPAWHERGGFIIGGHENEDREAFLAWPLEGTFEVSALTLADELHAGGLGYGGFAFHVDHETGSAITRVPRATVSINRSGLKFPTQRFVRQTLRVSPQQVTLLVNGHLVHTESRGAGGSPWLTLFGGIGKAAVWTNVSITGTPTIPREVSLSSGEFLQGWSSRLVPANLDNLSRSEPAKQTGGRSSASDNDFDWQCHNGEIIGHHAPDLHLLDSTTNRGLLQYDRPLADGDSVSWEFFRARDTSEVHPALGRLAMLLRPDGLRLHWLTTESLEQLVLPSDHEVAWPNSDQTTLQLHDGWNSGSLSIMSNSMRLRINDRDICELPLEGLNSRQFGLFHERSRVSARVKNVRLTGAWPEQFTPELARDLMIVGDDELQAELPETVARSWEQAKQVLANVQSRHEVQPGAESSNLQPLSDSWTPYRELAASLREQGVPEMQWRQSASHTVVHVAGCEADRLAWHQPLKGAFVFEAELVPAHGSYPRVSYGGVSYAPIDSSDNQSVHVRLIVANGRCTIVANGVQMADAELGPDADPFLIIHAGRLPGVGVRKATLTGSPEQPAGYAIDTSRALSSWRGPYFDNGDATIGKPSSNWRSDQGAVLGLKRATIAGSGAESLLQLRHPLNSNGTLTWSFQCQSGEQLVHPALDGTAFLLDRDRGVLLHDITNGVFDLSGADPTANRIEPDSQLSQRLGLIESEWNTMELMLSDGTMTLTLNGDPIYRTSCSSAPVFGLFHYPGETGARVRDMAWQNATDLND